ncbi:MAG: hypothetical protein KBS74_04335 [Clostridiales bacterium]|nr:hypothetical protein [Candidatus Cacconaster stercorequi]
MDKRTVLDSTAQSSEERVLLGHVWDKWQQTARQNIPTVTAFLSPHEQAAVKRLLQTVGAENDVFFGGYDSAERRQLHFLPDWMEAPDGDAVTALRCSFYHGDKAPTHRDLLGSLMGLGVTRGSIGDILVSSESADVLVASGVAEFLLQQWSAAGRTPLRVKVIPLTELLVPPEQYREIRDTVASLRLDSVAATGFSTSRAKAAEAIAQGRVEVNWTECRKADRTVEAGDVITVRGAGKCKLSSVGAPTRKGRFPICVKRYI